MLDTLFEKIYHLNKYPILVTIIKAATNKDSQTMASNEGQAVGSFMKSTGTSNLTRNPYFNIFSNTRRPVDITNRTTHKFNTPR